MEIDNIVAPEAGWRQVLVKLENGHPVFRVEPIVGWAFKSGRAVPLGPDSEIHNDYRLVGVVSPICEASTEELIAQAMRGVLN
jgi:hypothetical protein